MSVATRKLARQGDGRGGAHRGYRVVIFSEGFAKVAEQYLKKGSKVYLEGQLQTRNTPTPRA